MANVRAVIKRRKAVQNIHTITAAMELIAAARLRKAQNRVTASQPATDMAESMLSWVKAATPDFHDVLLDGRDGGKKTTLLVQTSDRGLCGGYNSRILEQTRRVLQELMDQGKTPRLIMIGRRGVQQGRHWRLDAAHGHELMKAQETIEQFEGPSLYELVVDLAGSLVQDMRSGQADEVVLVYNPGRGPELIRLLPLEVADPRGAAREYDYLPDVASVRETLLPLVLRQRMYRYVLRGMAGEQQTRMSAMHAATDAANDIIAALTQRINRVRQSQITKELSEIISGAEAQE